MNILVGVSCGGRQRIAQQALALGRAPEEQLGHSCQQRQPHRHRLLREPLHQGFQQVRRILQ